MGYAGWNGICRLEWDMPAGMDYGRRSANKRKEVYTMDVRKIRNAA